MQAENDQTWQSIVDRVIPGGRLLRSWRLEGGVSAEVTALEVLEEAGQRKKLVVRRHGEGDWKRDPEVAAKEFELLRVLHAQGIPVPRAYEAGRCDDMGAQPYVIVEYIEGSSGLDEPGGPESARQLAEALARLHGVACNELQGEESLARQDQQVAAALARKPAHLDDSLDEGIIRSVLEASWPPASRNSDAILHGDYWPGNTLWRDGSLAAVIDWEDAAIGDPLADLANARLEMEWIYGEEAAETFMTRYRELMPQLSYANQPLWELVAALRPASRLQEWGLDRQTEQRMLETHRRFVKRAFRHML